jgi:ribosomal protein S18 acetylase RimI-like enzyme
MLKITTDILTPALVRFYDHLQRHERETIGRVTHEMLLKYSSTGRLHTLWHDRDPLGYIIANDTSRHPTRTQYPNQMRIYVACIDYGMQRRLFGTILVDHIERIARLRRLDSIGLWCAEDIPARDFWTSIGFTPQRERDGGRKRKRKLIEYSRRLPTARPV